MTTAPENQLWRVIPGKLWSLPASLFGETARKGMVSLVDQLVVSGTRFLTTVIVGRYCGAEELGVYALGFSMLIFLTALQETLITTPYAIFGSRQTDDQRRQYAGSLLIHQGVMILTVVALLAAVGAVLTGGLTSSPWVTMLWVLAASIPFALLREFARRFAFADMHVVAALAVDITVAVVQLGGLLLLARSGALTAPGALLVMAACAVVGTAWLVASRHQFRPRPQSLLPHLAQNWKFGKWLFGSQMVGVLSGYSVYWLLAILISSATTGIYTACSTVVLLANPFILGLCNVLEPKTARAFAHGGKLELLRVVRKVTLLAGLFLSTFWLSIYILGERIVALLYDDPAFAHQGHTITALASALVVVAVGVGYNYGLKAAGHPQWNFYASLIDLTVMLLTAVPLAWSLGMVGGAYCILCGGLAGTVTRYLVFTRLMTRED